jgi:predicted GH43/DUF377 family glycosyl hydrolase
VTRAALVTRTAARIGPDPTRVIARLFVPGHEAMTDGESRAMPVIERILAMTDDEVAHALSRTFIRYEGRHRDLPATLRENFSLVAHRLGERVVMDRERRLLIGAYFTQEYAVEAAALFNPSIVLHPDQSGLTDGEARFVMSLRAVGEGHLSCIEFRTGVVSGDAAVRFDPPGSLLSTGIARTSSYRRDLLRDKMIEEGEADENARFVWDALPERFDRAQLETALSDLRLQSVTRRDAHAFVDKLRWAADCNYTVEFDGRSLSERVLWPRGPAESHGMEDARFVRFVGDDGAVTYYATYTAFSGAAVTPQLIETTDFQTFSTSQLAGPAAKNKGMALFPRRVGGRYVALSRWDGENNGVSFSDDGHRWGISTMVEKPRHPWELVQIGNCGSPIETDAGWLFLTHGVGPMREYAIGAGLLSLDDPTHLIGTLSEPLLVPDAEERVGYVPNVLYSCGSLVHGDTLVLPYGCGDSAIRIATMSVDALLDRLTG